jgi:hypothetical protein
MALKIEGNLTIIGFEDEPNITAFIQRIQHDPQVVVQGSVTLCLIPPGISISGIEAMTAAVGAKPSAIISASKA